MDPELDSEVARIRAERLRARIAWWILFPAWYVAVELSGDRVWVWLPIAIVFAAAAQLLTIITFCRACPRCGAPLKVERFVRRHLPPRCPHCRLKIEEDGEP